MKRFFFPLVILLAFTSFKIYAFSNKPIQKNEKPKLVVGIVIDQMRYDYLTRFKDRFGEGGFKRIINNGYNLKNTHLNYSPSKTAVGHASIYTGTSPKNHGIMGNDWYDKYLDKSVYCVTDENFTTVGSNSSKGNRSPHRLITNTIGDQLHLAQNMHGKVIGISLKDRGAILPAGFSANAAYWYDTKAKGAFISSTYYMDKLPRWVSTFNKSKTVDNYLNSTWDTFYDIATYTNSTKDNTFYEKAFKGEKAPVFPHKLKKLKRNNGYSLLKDTPQGNSLLTDFAITAIDNEKLGQGNFTDLLTISYSATDGVGHQFGPNSIEIEDTYIRMDLELERLLNHLDKTIGKNNYTLFLTADHAVTETPHYLNDHKLPGNYQNSKEFINDIKDIAEAKFGDRKLIAAVANNSIFLSEEHLKSNQLDRATTAQIIADELIKHKNIYKTVSYRTLQTRNFTDGLLALVQQGYNQKYSGDVIFVYTPSILSDWYKNGGTTHGSPYSYDTHIPLLFYGNGIKTGSSNHYYPVVDIASTICTLLDIEFTNGNTGHVIEEVLE